MTTIPEHDHDISTSPDLGCPRCRLGMAAPELLAACKEMREAILEHGLLDVKKRFSLCVADAAMGSAIAKAEHD
jgi:hypothetical protein